MTTLQKVILGAFMYGVSIQDIAKVIGKPETIVEDKLREAMKK